MHDISLVMAENEKNILENIGEQEYKYGFTTDIETETIGKGLSEEVVRLISAKKGEPEWMTERRVAAYRHWLTLEPPTWAHLTIPPIDFQDIIYYAAPKPKKQLGSMDEVDPELKRTFDKLGIPLEEQMALAGVAVDAVMDSVSVKTTFREVLAEKDADSTIYPASMTKMMTSLLAIEANPDLDTPVTLPEEIFPALQAQNASQAGFQAGETATVRDLLYGAMLPSGAECCEALAREVSGSEEAFAARMNQKAAELGMTATHFCNPTGLHDPEHVSTVRDMARLTEAALQNETFRKLFTTERYTVPATNCHPQGFTMHSTLLSQLEGTELHSGRILGGKTGYTGEAGLCLASLAEVKGREYILVTAGAGGNHSTAPYHIEDAVTVYRRVSRGS